MKVGNLKVIDYLFINGGEICAVKGIDTITKSRHLYLGSPEPMLGGMYSEEDYVKRTIKRGQKFKDDEIESLLSWFTQRPGVQ